MHENFLLTKEDFLKITKSEFLKIKGLGKGDYQKPTFKWCGIR